MIFVVLIAVLAPQTLTVGDGKQFSRIEDAVASALPNAEIEVYPSQAGYKKTAVLIRTPGLRIVGKAGGKGQILIDGSGFEYSGAGKVPRAIFQVDPGADGVSIENFELRGAHNASHNGAGVRINAANDVKVIGCDIHDNNMGAMSNGIQGDPKAGGGQLFLSCTIHGNGSLADPGYNHNLYLGGTSVKLENCEIYRSLTGHNVKSRAHFTLISHCFIHDSANREMDFVEAWDTERPNSNAVVRDTIIAKDSECAGNRTTIHFGREKGVRQGRLYLLSDTIVTYFQSPVIELTSSDVGTTLFNNVILNAEEAAPLLIAGLGGSVRADGASNWISSCYSIEGTDVDRQTRYQGQTRRENLGSVPPGFNLKKHDPSWKTAKGYYVDGDGKRVDDRDAPSTLGGTGLLPRL